MRIVFLLALALLAFGASAKAEETVYDVLRDMNAKNNSDRYSDWLLRICAYEMLNRRSGQRIIMNETSSSYATNCMSSTRSAQHLVCPRPIAPAFLGEPPPCLGFSSNGTIY